MKRLVPSLFTLCSCLIFVLTFIPASTAAAIVQAPRIRAKDGTSTNWSGYAVETSLTSPQSGAVSDVKGTWTVPSVTCGSTATYSSFWVGIDGYSSNSVEQTGTDSDCSGGSGVYYAWYEMYPKASQVISGLAVHPGNVISAEVRFNGSGSFTLILDNTSTGGHFSINLSSRKAARSSAEWIAEAPSSGGVLPLANFGTVNFSNASATLKGVSGSISSSAWQNDAITMVNSSGAVKAAVSGLGSGGSSFGVSWKSSN